jgi:CBS domain-containing protein
LNADSTVAEALGKIGKYGFSSYPVVEENDSYIGIVSEARLRRTVAEGKGQTSVRKLIEPGDYVFPDQPLVRAVVHMNNSNVRQLAVLERDHGNSLRGILTMSDIVRAHARAALSAGEPDRTVVPGFTELNRSQEN